MTTLAQRARTTAHALPRAHERDARVRRWRRIGIFLLVGIGALAILNILVGFVAVLAPSEIWRALTDPENAPPLHTIAVNTRVPRALLGVMVGVSLGAAGALLQALTRNPLASPELTGVTAGAVAATLAWVAFGLPLPAETAAWIQPLIAFGGGLLTAAAVYLLARRTGAVESTRLILIGVLVGGILSSLTTLSLLVLRSEVEQILRWLAGDLAFATWDKLLRSVVYLVPGIALLLLAVPRANALQLGDDVARGLGQHRERDRFLVLLAAVALTAAAVTFVGVIGFVGFVGPHIARRWVGSDLRRLVPASALTGACMVLVADFVARNFNLNMLPWDVPQLRNPALPVGVYISLFAIPFVITLVWKRSR